jgi:hypothetical protein
MLDRSRVFQSLPSGLRTPLAEEYNSIVQNFSEQRWTPAELSGGKFCEIVYTILDGHAKGSFPSNLASLRSSLMPARSWSQMPMCLEVFKS